MARPAPDCGDWKNAHRRFCRWRDKGVWESLLEALIDEPGFEWLMAGASHVKARHDGTGAVGGNRDMGRTKGGPTPRHAWPWMRMAAGRIHLYRLRHLVENAFMHLKRWRTVATRHAKDTSSFVAAVQIRCLVLRLHIS